MLYPKIEDCVAKTGCKYALAVLIAKRAKELAQKMPGEFTSGNVKEISYALDEVLLGEIIPHAITR